MIATQQHALEVPDLLADHLALVAKVTTPHHASQAPPTQVQVALEDAVR